MRSLISILILMSGLYAQETINLNAAMPVDSNVVTGTLGNGFKYYIRYNNEPQNRADLRLVVKAGSILEDENQLGLAHFNEHMAFNGTENFKKHELIDFLEKSGMRFGADVNAYTSFDETVYILQLPTDSMDVFLKGFQVLEDWAHNLSFDSLEIEKERGVVIEEWRTRRGVAARIRDKQFPVLFHNSRYAERLPIGKKELLENFDPNDLIRFYRDWYRPDLMAVIAVGDFDVNKVRELITEHFSSLKNPKNEEERKYYKIPDHKKTLFSIVTDPEERYSRISLYTKIDTKEDSTIKEYRTSIIKNLYTSMLNQRLAELSQSKNPPFLYAVTGESRFVKSRGFYVMNAVVAEGKIESGMEALLTESERVLKYGFTKSELDREKKSFLRNINQAMRESDKRKSQSFASEYIRAFLYGEPFPGLEYETKLYHELIPGISLNEVDKIGDEWLQDKSRVLMVSLSEKEGLAVPTEESLKKVLDTVADKKITAYQDVVLDNAIINPPATVSKIQAEKRYEDINVIEWTLANGVKVVLKPTDFKNDQILFSATSPGGTSLISLDSLISAELADGLTQNSGVGNYKLIELEKYLSDKVASASPYISSINEGFRGSASPEDLETMLQIVYAYFTAPRLDKDAFESYKSKMEAVLLNRENNPQTAFSDTLNAILTQHDPRDVPMKSSDLDKMDRLESFRIFKQRFADGNDFTFFFVGNFQPDSIKPLVEQYLGSLPVLPGEETWADDSNDYPKGIYKKDVFKGIEPKSMATLVFTGPFKWNIKNRFVANALVDVIRIKLRERIREDKSGTYSVSVRGSFVEYPKPRYQVSISFGSDPDRVEELTNEIFVQIDSLKNIGTTLKYLDKVKETDTREYELSLRENGYWLNNIQYAYFHNIEPNFVLDVPELIKELTLDDIHEAAKKYLDKNNFVKVVLFPEDEPAND